MRKIVKIQLCKRKKFMLSKKTCLILGAGASAHLGFPLGAKLRIDILDILRDLKNKHTWPDEFIFLFIVLAAAGISVLMSFLQSLEIDQIFHLAEVILWISIASVFLFRLQHTQNNRDLSITCVIAFALFGVSDFIEINTRAWYQPLSLFILKACCVLTLVTVFIIYRRRRKIPPDKSLQ
ncbi:hypothetical protein [uncultured Gimesia sp.]|uniref:hypothetical protein n=1 Tax=uncultured Gimesia sp. TaxID=1678688 RepID=UPI0026071873|nr:hypothetical protein [uncultured Gimesia sp.]